MGSEEHEKFRQFVQRLKDEEGRSSALNDIKTLLTFKPAEQAASFIKDVGISKIVQCLNMTEKSHVDLTCEVLKMCFEKFKTGEVVKNYTSHIMYLLRHELSCVRKLAVDEVHKAVSSNPDALPVPKYIDVFVAVSQLMADPDVGVTSKAIAVTSHLPEAAYPKVLEEMKVVLEFGSSAKCNAYEVITNISSDSQNLLALSAANGYITYMLNELNSDDVLYQLNILELLSRLAVKPHGIKFFVEQGSLQQISRLVVEQKKKQPLGNLLQPGYMKFFGCIAHLYPKEVFEKYPVLLNSLFEAFDSTDQTILPTALDTLGFIGSTVEGKLSLAALGSRYTQAVEKVGNFIKTGITEIKIRALHCLSSLIGYEQSPDTTTVQLDHRVTLMTREWFRSLSAKPEAMEVLQGICQNPFPEIKLAGFCLLHATCQHSWGEDLVARTPGFIEYLLDRSVEHAKECKEAKYDIIKGLSRSSVFDAPTMMKIKTYIEQGPFYTESEMQIVTED